MNDARNQVADLDATPANPNTEILPSVGTLENSIEDHERLPNSQTSFFETVYYWVISRS